MTDVEIEWRPSGRTLLDLIAEAGVEPAWLPERTRPPHWRTRAARS